jgi:hypothetical protein
LLYPDISACNVPLFSELLFALRRTQFASPKRKNAARDIRKNPETRVAALPIVDV